jgi:hypothetical protein
MKFSYKADINSLALPFMRTLLYVPVAYVAGIEGFGLFLPYIVFIAAVMVMSQYMKTRPQPIEVAELQIPEGLLADCA